MHCHLSFLQVIALEFANLLKKESVADDFMDKQRKEVEVLYEDGEWYHGWLSNFNFATGKWKVQFYDDDETTEVKFPDKDVRLVQ